MLDYSDAKFKIGDVVRTVHLTSLSLSSYDRTFNDLVGTVSKLRLSDDGFESYVYTVRFFKGQRRTWGLIGEGFLKSVNVLDAMAYLAPQT